MFALALGSPSLLDRLDPSTDSFPIFKGSPPAFPELLAKLSLKKLQSGQHYVNIMKTSAFEILDLAYF